MTLSVLRAGLQTTLQGAPRRGWRHWGAPWSGPADALSHSLALALVGMPAEETALEIAFSGAAFRFEADAAFALAGAPCAATLDGAPVALFESRDAKAGAALDIGPATAGARVYLAVSKGFSANISLGSASTYLPAGLGGLEGRALKDGDALPFAGLGPEARARIAPPALRPVFTGAHALRAVEGPEADWLTAQARTALFAIDWRVGARLDRMGARLEGPALAFSVEKTMKSSGVLPGTVQATPSGAPYLLGPDAQTTGGYPRVLQVIAGDTHLFGQLRPGDRVRFLKRDAAAVDSAAKARFWAEALERVRRG